MPGVSLVEQEDGKWSVVSKENGAVISSGLTKEKAWGQWSHLNKVSTKAANLAAKQSGKK